MKRKATLIKAYTAMCAWATLAAIAAVILTLTITGCDDSVVLGNVPTHVNAFIEQYWPGCEISALQTEKDKGCTVKIKDGPTIEFDSSEAWTNIKGNGVALPATMLFDQLPQPLYRFLQEMGATGGVYGIERSAESYTLQLLDSKISYNIATEKVTYLT